MEIEKVVSIKGLKKRFELGKIIVTALRGVNLEIHKGEFVSIVGPSGSGKSTLMNILGALDKPTSGEYILDGEHIDELSDDELAEIRNRKIGFVFQSYNLLPRVTSNKNVMIPMMYGGVDRKERKRKVSR